jgi:tetratricopeptide (TPR) repeat protein
MSMSRKERRATAKTGGPPAPTPVRYPQVRSALDMAGRLRNRGQPEAALDLCQRALAIEPEHPEVHFTIATILEQTGDWEKAARSYARVVELAPSLLAGLVNYAACLSRLGEFGESLKLYGKALKLVPASPVVHQHLALYYMQLRRHDRALVHYEWMAANHGRFDDMVELAGARDRAGDQRGALKAYAAAMKLASLDSLLHTSMARIHQVRGDRDSARKHIDAALKADPHEGYAHYTKAKYFIRPDEVNEEIAAVETALTATPGRPAESGAAPLNFALGRLWELRGDTDRAFAAFVEANRLIAPLRRNDDETQARAVDQQAATLTPGRLAELARYGNTSRQPTFVVGMPRSGTSLIEQISASHSQVYGLGEFELMPILEPGLRHLTPRQISATAQLYLDAYPPLARKAARATDKSISSFYYIGLILLLFPNAKIISCERHPLDLAWSIFSEFFNDNALAYSYDFGRIAYQLRLYRRSLDHWERLFPERILKVHYEAIVADPEPSSRRLAGFLGLEWEPAMMQFHHTARIVRTASLEQVRQPIYKSSVGRWQKYRSHLQPVADDLKDLIQAYETTIGGQRGGIPERPASDGAAITLKP